MAARHDRSTQPTQIMFDWSEKSSSPQAEECPKPASQTTMPSKEPTAATPEPIESSKLTMPATTGLVQVLPWDFRGTFPQPLQEAIAAGKLHEDDLVPENLKSLHDEHANHALTILSDFDAVEHARRSGVDPRTGRLPGTEQQREALQKLFDEEPKRLQHAFDLLIDVYEEAFGAAAADAFRKAIRARHAGVEVMAEFPPTPQPIADAVASGVFGEEEDGTLVNPDANEVAEIMESVTHALANMPEGPERTALLSKCAEDFGSQAADELERWSRLKTQADDASIVDYDPGHPWHYYYKGDGAEPLPLDAIPARATTLEQLGVKLPKSPAKRVAFLQKMLYDQRQQLAQDEARYQELIDRGVKALSKYDREIAHGGDDDLAIASAIALKFNHVSGTRGRVQMLERSIGRLNPQGGVT